MSIRALPIKEILKQPERLRRRLNRETLFLTDEAQDTVWGVLISPEVYQALTDSHVALAVRLGQLLTLGIRGDEDPVTVLPQMRQVFPWIDDLVMEDRVLCVSELLSAFARYRESGHTAPLREAIEGWQATADIEADPALMETLMPGEPDQYTAWETFRARV